MNVSDNKLENSGLSNFSSNSSDFDLDKYITSQLGAKRVFESNILIVLTLIYFAIFCAGLVGNTCTCLVIIKNQYMQTATNFYLFNLAIADMITLIFAMPLETYIFWEQYPWDFGLLICQMKAIIPETSGCASILTIVAFTLERYIAICHPIHIKTKSKFSRATKVIVVIWTISLFCSIPYGKFIQLNYLRDPKGNLIEQSRWCGFPYNDPKKQWETLIMISAFVFFVIPMFIISFLYFRIATVLHRSDCLRESYNNGNFQRKSGVRSQSRTAVIRMLCAVVIAFFICWAPYHTQRLLFVYVSIYSKWSVYLREINEKLFIIGGCLYYFNSTVNPILYSLMSNRFRVAFRETLCSPGRGCCWFLKQPKCEPEFIASYRNSNSQNSSDKPGYRTGNTLYNVPLKELKNQNCLAHSSSSGLKINGKSKEQKFDARKLSFKRSENFNEKSTKKSKTDNFEIVKCGAFVMPDVGFICFECSLDFRKIETCPICSKYTRINYLQPIFFGKGTSLSTGDLLQKPSVVDNFQTSESAM